MVACMAATVAGMVKEPLHPFLTALSACVSALSRNSYRLCENSTFHQIHDVQIHDVQTNGL